MIPAWMVMMAGREPGELGLYGFRHRKKVSAILKSQFQAVEL